MIRQPEETEKLKSTHGITGTRMINNMYNIGSFEEVNNNGQRLIELWQLNEMRIPNGF